jgi:hypothetical protein
MVNTPDLGPGCYRSLHGSIRTLVVDDKHTLTALREGIANGSLDNVRLEPGPYDTKEAYWMYGDGPQRVRLRAGPQSANIELQA